MRKALALLVLVMGCGSGDVTLATDVDGDASTPGNNPGKDGGGGGNNNNNHGGDSGTNNGSDSGTTPQVDTVRFAAIGDTGKGNTAQREVADAVEAKCKASGC